MSAFMLTGFGKTGMNIPAGAQSVQSDRLTALFQQVDADLPLKLQAVRHDKFVTSVSQKTEFLPVSYGRSTVTMEKCGAWLRGRSVELLKALQTYGQSVEISFFLTMPVAELSGSGGDYLANRRRWIVAIRDQRDNLKLMFNAFVAEAKILAFAMPEPAALGQHMQIDVCLLKQSYTNDFNSLRGSIENMAEIARVSGPFAPYNFGNAAISDERLAA